jgi:hypothetical protein
MPSEGAQSTRPQQVLQQTFNIYQFKKSVKYWDRKRTKWAEKWVGPQLWAVKSTLLLVTFVSRKQWLWSVTSTEQPGTSHPEWWCWCRVCDARRQLGFSCPFCFLLFSSWTSRTATTQTEKGGFTSEAGHFQTVLKGSALVWVTQCRHLWWRGSHGASMSHPLRASHCPPVFSQKQARCDGACL